MKNQSDNLVLWEDDKVHRGGGVTMLRPFWAMRSGAGLLRECAHEHFTNEPARWVRPHLVAWQHICHPGTIINKATRENALLANSRLWDASCLRELPTDEEWIVTTPEEGEETVVAAMLSPANQEKLLQDYPPDGLPSARFFELLVPVRPAPGKLELIKHPFDLLFRQESVIEKQIAIIAREYPEHAIGEQARPGIWVDSPERIFIHPSVKIGMQTFLDASEGSIWIDEGTVIEGNAFLKGPLAVGKKCTLRAGLKLYGPSSIGPVCKLGGEIQQTLWMGYSNKQHDGYLGTAVVGSWVNIGAGTNNSDLKNTYGPITITIAGERIETGEIHIGCLLGDHTKTSIGLQLNTGTVTGIACNIFGAGFPQTYIPSFSWGGADWLREHGLSKAIETARIAMSRRKKEFVPEIEQMFHYQFNQTIIEREKYLKKSN
ncbi:MAG: putative sugar nucleotidyl transferase [bacterium]|nr:putative sugar nucleotidyl transferase [bacterium]